MEVIQPTDEIIPTISITPGETIVPTEIRYLPIPTASQ
jgi:hypothetical protein